MFCVSRCAMWNAYHLLGALSSCLFVSFTGCVAGPYRLGYMPVRLSVFQVVTVTLFLIHLAEVVECGVLDTGVFPLFSQLSKTVSGGGVVGLFVVLCKVIYTWTNVKLMLLLQAL